MALSASVLATLMRSKMDALTDDQKADRDASYNALASAVVEHIQAAAQIAGVCVGLTSAPGGGPVTGTATLPPGSIL